MRKELGNRNAVLVFPSHWALLRAQAETVTTKNSSTWLSA